MAASNSNTLTLERLREILNYDPETGIFTRVNCPNCIKHLEGKEAGHLRTVGEAKGYRAINVDGKRYGAHRLAWFWVHGEWPVGALDHINRIRDDNRIANLRLASPMLQSQNQDAKGVSFRERSGKWHARICADGEQIHLGFYETEAEARAAYLGAKRVCHSSYFDAEAA